jgi:hypothetical protein
MASSRNVLVTSALLAGALLAPFVLACNDRRAPSEPRETGPRLSGARSGSDPTSASFRPGFDGPTPVGMGVAGALSGKLPSTDTVTSSVPAFEIKQKGGGIAGRFEITNPNSAAIALDGVSSGTGHALLAWNLGRGRGAVVITSNSTNTLPALDVSSQSLGTVGSTTFPGLASAMDVRANNTTSTNPAVQLATIGQGTVLQVNHRGPAGNLAVFQVAGVNKIRFDHTGRAFFNSGLNFNGADVAEAFAVEGRRRDYAPGDVLVISDSSDRRVEWSDEAYSTRVIGVYATKPGVVLAERPMDASLGGRVPVGVLGVIPTKVSGENGAIRRGDLLVTATIRGHAMLGTQRDRMLGAVVGKALAEFTGPGTGVIPVLVNVR